MKRNRARIWAAVPLAFLATSLIACSSDDQPAGGSSSVITVDALGVDCAVSGATSDSIKIVGEHGQPLELDVKLPVKVDDLERTVHREGWSTTPYADGEATKAAISIFNGSTGTQLSFQSADQSVALPNNGEQLSDWAYEAVRCGADGQRVSLVMPAELALEGNTEALTNLGLKEDDALIFVVDFRDQFATCDSLEPRGEEYPKVQIGSDIAEPFIEIAECMEPPADLEIEVLVEGDGPVVEADETIMTNYVGVYWNGGKRFDGNWSDEGIAFSTREGALISGFTQAMVGQKIGSTILVTMPSELGYDDGNTRTFVLQLVEKVEADG